MIYLTGCDILGVRGVQICLGLLWWVLWGNRNSISHGSRGSTVDESVLKVRSYLEMFSKRNVICRITEKDPYTIHRNKWTVFCDGA